MDDQPTKLEQDVARIATHTWVIALMAIMSFVFSTIAIILVAMAISRNEGAIPTTTKSDREEIRQEVLDCLIETPVESIDECED
jgi:hypothetical protein